MSLIALEIESNRIHVAAARAASRRTQIQHLFTVDVNGSDEEVAKQLRGELAKRNLGRSEAIVVVSRANAEIRLLDVPPAPENELPNLVRFVARNEFASLNDNWLLDFIRLTGDESTTGQVLAAGVSPEMSNQFKSIVELAGLKLKHMVLRPFATVGLVQDRWHDDGIRMLIDPNDDQTDMSIISGKSLVATRTVRVPVSHGDHVEKLVPEIRRTLASSSRAVGGKPVNQVIVFGDADYNETMGEKLRSRLDVDVAFIDPLKLPMVSNKLSADEHGSRYVALMGALSMDAARQTPPIDFLNPRKAIEKQSSPKKLFMYGGLAAAVALLAIGFAWWTLNQQKQRIADLTDDLNQIEARNNGDLGGPSVDQKVAEVAKVDEWMLNRVDWQQQLAEFSSVALTADETMVDSFRAIGPQQNTPAKITVGMRVADFATSGELVKSLERKYTVIPSGTSDAKEETDEDYPVGTQLTLPLPDINQDLIKQINELAEAYFKEQAARRLAEQKAKQAAESGDVAPATEEDASTEESTSQDSA